MDRPFLRSGPHAQRGAAAVFAAITMIAMLIAALLAVEIGRMYSAHRQLKKIATVAALDAVRVASGCYRDIDAPPISQSDIDATVLSTLTQHGLADLIGTAVIEPGRVNILREGEGSGTRELESGPAADAQAVRVSLSRPFPTPLLPFMSNSGRIMAATATAEQSVVGSFYLGSGLLGVDGGILNGLLEGLLGGDVNLSVIDYQGLAAVGVSLEALALAVGLEARDLSDPLALETQSPVLGDVLSGLADALSDQLSPQLAAAVRDLGEAAEAGDNPPVLLGLLLDDVNGTAPQAPFVNLVDLIIGLAAAANADENGAVAPIALPIALGIPGLADLQTFIKILQPPQFSGMRRAGEAEAHTAQLQLQIRLQVNALTSIADALSLVLLGGLLGDIEAPPINLGIDVDVARASAYLDRIQCPSRADPTIAATLSARPSVATVKLGTFVGNPAAAPAIAEGVERLIGVRIQILGGLIADIPVNLFLQEPVDTAVGNAIATPLDPVTEFTRVEAPGATPYALADAPVTGMNPQTVGSTGLLGGTMASLFSSLDIRASSPNHPNASSNICLLRVIVCIVQIPVGTILDAVLDPVVALLGVVLNGVGGIVDALLDPLLQALGIQLGSATVTMTAVSLDQPHIVSMDPAPVAD